MDTLKTTTNRTWLIKFGIFLAVSVGLAAWFLIDGFIVYPAKGEEHARFMLKEHLTVLRDTGSLTSARASSTDPAEELATLAAKPQPTAPELAKRQWLESLARVRALPSLAGDVQSAPDAADANYLVTRFPNPRATLTELDQLIGTADTPSGLSNYDIPVQILIGIIASVLSLFVAFRILQTMATSFSYHPGDHRLTGKNLDVTPADIELVDKRKWDKFFVFLNFKDNRPEHKLDLYRFSPLEDWVLEMEALTEGFEPEPDADSGTILTADLYDKTARHTPVPEDHDGPLVFTNDDGQPTRYPAINDASGHWHIVGKAERQALLANLESGSLDRARTDVDPDNGFATTIDTVEERESDDDAPGGTADEALAEAPAGDDHADDASRS